MGKAKDDDTTSLEKHENGFYYIHYNDGRSRVKSTKEKDKLAANKVYTAWLEAGGADQSKGKLAGDDLTIVDCENLYLEHQPFKRRKDVAPMFLVIGGFKVLDPQTPGKVTAFYRDLLNGKDTRKLAKGHRNLGVSTITANCNIQYIRRVVRWCEKHSDKNGARYLPAGTYQRFENIEDKARVVIEYIRKAVDFAPTPQDFGKLIDFSKTYRHGNRDNDLNRMPLAYRAVTMFGFAGAPRRERCTRMRWEGRKPNILLEHPKGPHLQFEFVDGIRNSDTKTGNPFVPLHDIPGVPADMSLLKIVRQAEREKINEYYFDGITDHVMGDILRACYRGALGLDFGGSHNFRKMVATDLKNRGLSHLVAAVLNITQAIADAHYIKGDEDRSTAGLLEFQRGMVATTGKIVPLKRKAR